MPNPTNIAIAGDVHGSSDQIYAHLKYAQNYFNDHFIYLQLGDWNLFESRRFREDISHAATAHQAKIYYIDGNHDDFPFLASFAQPHTPSLVPDTNNIYYLPRNAQIMIDDITFHAIGGAQSIDLKWRRTGMDHFTEETITQQDIDYALSMPQLPSNSVMLSHDAPHTARNPITEDHNSQAHAASVFSPEVLALCYENQSKLTQVTDHLKPSLLFHGHYHHYYTKLTKHSDGTPYSVTGLNEGSQTESLYVTTSKDLKEVIALVRETT